jgi:hypothetical protein
MLKVIGLPLAKNHKPELSWSQIIYEEIVHVTNAMRKHHKWQLAAEEPTPKRARSAKNKKPEYNYCQDFALAEKPVLDSILAYTSKYAMTQSESLVMYLVCLSLGGLIVASIQSFKGQGFLVDWQVYID